MKVKMKRKPLLFSFPLKTHNHPLRRKTQNTRRIHRECLKGNEGKNEKKTLTLFLPLKNTNYL